MYKNNLVKIISLALIFSGATIFAGCSRQVSDDYLIAHPQELKNVLISCQNANFSEQQSPTCMQALRVFNQLAQYGQQLQLNPANYGKQIMQAQTQLANIRAQLQLAEKTYSQLTQSSNSNTKEIALTESKLQTLQEQYRAQEKTIRMMLTVAALAGE